MTQIIDTFLFSEPHESDLLYIKLKNEEPVVNWWIIQENEFTTKGEHKGLFAKKVLEEERFKPYLHKIITISASEKLSESGEEHANFQREGWQRTLCYSTLKAITRSPNDMIIVSDVDESIDFTCEKRQLRFMEFLNSIEYGRPFWIGRMRYWYDYDNRCYLPNIRIPIVHYGNINNINILPQVRHYHEESRTLQAGEDPIAFEYSYVFKTWQDVQRKHVTYAHTGLSDESDVRRGLSLNAWIRSNKRGEKRSEYDFFEKVELTERNSPRYVRENIDTLRTGIVDTFYKENRKNTPEIYI